MRSKVRGLWIGQLPRPGAAPIRLDKRAYSWRTISVPLYYSDKHNCQKLVEWKTAGTCEDDAVRCWRLSSGPGSSDRHWGRPTGPAPHEDPPSPPWIQSAAPYFLPGYQDTAAPERLKNPQSLCKLDRLLHFLNLLNVLDGLFLRTDPHLSQDRLVAAVLHPQTGPDPPFRHPFHSGADESYCRAAVVGNHFIEMAQSCTYLSLCTVYNVKHTRYSKYWCFTI